MATLSILVEAAKLVEFDGGKRLIVGFACNLLFRYCMPPFLLYDDLKAHGEAWLMIESTWICYVAS